MDDSKELLLALIKNAKTGKHTKFYRLRFFSEYIGGLITYSATKKVVNFLKYSTNSLLKKYCKAVQDQQADVNLLFAYKQLQQATDFYKEEQSMLKNILADYETYLFTGNFLVSFLFWGGTI